MECLQWVCVWKWRVVCVCDVEKLLVCLWSVLMVLWGCVSGGGGAVRWLWHWCCCGGVFVGFVGVVVVLSDGDGRNYSSSSPPALPQSTRFSHPLTPTLCKHLYSSHPLTQTYTSAIRAIQPRFPHFDRKRVLSKIKDMFECQL